VKNFEFLLSSNIVFSVTAQFCELCENPRPFASSPWFLIGFVRWRWTIRCHLRLADIPVWPAGIHNNGDDQHAAYKNARFPMFSACHAAYCDLSGRYCAFHFGLGDGRICIRPDHESRAMISRTRYIEMIASVSAIFLTVIH
jgi:hypothetical protein